MASAPLVSLLLPNLNKQPFIAERIATIEAQTFRDWECVIVDSLSDDGSAEALEDFCRRDARARFIKAPRDGLYRNWNRALEAARGKYVYFATSDDTMMPDCLEQSVAALEQHPEVDLCSFDLLFIDSSSQPARPRWQDWHGQLYYGCWMKKAHRRSAESERLRLFYFDPIHLSMTGLLIRRSLFEKTGLFRLDCGTQADSAWQFEAYRHSDCIHLPKVLATFRKDAQQATQLNRANLLKGYQRLLSEQMATLPLQLQERVLQGYCATTLSSALKYASNARGRWNAVASILLSPFPLLLMFTLALSVHAGMGWPYALLVRSLINRRDLKPLPL